MADRDADGLAINRHGLTQAFGDVAVILDRVAGHVIVQRVEQLGDIRGRAVVDDIADAEIGAGQPGLAEQAILQRVGIERRERRLAILRGLPVGQQIGAAFGHQHGLMDPVRQDVQRLCLRKGWPGGQDGGASSGRAHEMAAGQ